MNKNFKKNEKKIVLIYEKQIKEIIWFHNTVIKVEIAVLFIFQIKSYQ